MFFAITLALIVLSIICHEAGHWFEMSKYGVPVSEAGLGFPFFKKLQIRFKLKKWPNTVLTLNPLLLGAYVSPRDGYKAFDNLPYKHAATICGAGPLANVIFFFVVSILAGLVAPNVTYTNPHNLILWGCFLAMALITFLARKYLSYILPLLGIASTAYLFHLMAKQNIAPLDGLAGPVGIIKIAKKASLTLHDSLSFAALISLYIGQANTIPIFPLDGGRAVDVLLKRWPLARNLFRSLGVMLIILIFVFVTTKDFLRK